MTIENARLVKRKKNQAAREVRQGIKTIADVLRSDSEYDTCMELWYLLTKAYNMGPSGARRVLEEAKVDRESRTVAELTNKEKGRLIEALPPRAFRRVVP